MTVSTAIINVGNHPGDVVEIVSTDWNNEQHSTTLKRGEYMMLTEKTEYNLGRMSHGSGDQCRGHVPSVLMIEGPGNEIVRTDFNPSNTNPVARLKTLYAAIINEIQALENIGYDVAGLKVMAKRTAEDSAMWAVKAATADKPIPNAYPIPDQAPGDVAHPTGGVA